MKSAGLEPFIVRGDYLISTTQGADKIMDGAHLGQFRVKIQWAPCD